MAIVTVRIPPASGVGDDVIVELVPGDLVADLPGLLDKVLSAGLLNRAPPVFIAGFSNLGSIKDFRRVSPNTKIISTLCDQELDDPDFFKRGHVIIPFDLGWFMKVIEKSGCDWDWLISDINNPPKYHQSLGHFIVRLFELDLVPETAPKIEAGFERIFATARQMEMTDATICAAEARNVL